MARTTTVFSDSMQGVSNLSFAVFESVKTMIQKNTFETSVDSKTQYINSAGDVYIPYSRKYGINEGGDLSFPRFIPGNAQGRNPDMGNMIYFQDFKRDYLNPEITTITYDKSFPLANLLRQLAEEKKVYGVVLQYENSESGSRMASINPLHPMIAFLTMAGIFELPSSGKLHVFEYKDSAVIQATEFNNTQKDEVASYEKDYEKFFAMAADIHSEPIVLKQHASISQETIQNIIDNPYIENLIDSVEIHKESRDQASTRGIESLIVPNQLIMDGTASPYYGIASITEPTQESIRGWGLGPMVTGNISLDHHGGARTFRRFQDSVHTRNVCTGSENSIQPKGWFTLSKVNLESMYFSDVISMNYVFPFIQASKNISAEIWKAFNATQNAALATAVEDTPAEAEEAEPTS